MHKYKIIETYKNDVIKRDINSITALKLTNMKSNSFYVLKRNQTKNHRFKEMNYLQICGKTNAILSWKLKQAPKSETSN